MNPPWHWLRQRPNKKKNNTTLQRRNQSSLSHWPTWLWLCELHKPESISSSSMFLHLKKPQIPTCAQATERHRLNKSITTKDKVAFSLWIRINFTALIKYHSSHFAHSRIKLEAFRWKKKRDGTPWDNISPVWKGRNKKLPRAPLKASWYAKQIAVPLCNLLHPCQPSKKKKKKSHCQNRAGFFSYSGAKSANVTVRIINIIWLDLE